VAELRTEEEQVKALKEWWNENGKSLLVGVALAAAAGFGWNAWQDKQAAEAEAASVLYQNMMDAVSGAIGPQQDDNQKSTAIHLAEQLKSEHESSAYARFAALMMARVAAEGNDYPTALAELDWLLAHEPAPAQKEIALMRKARILAAQGELDKALSVLPAASAGFSASVEEIRGDLLLLKGDKAGAREAYAKAKAGVKAGQGRPILDMKLDNLAAGEG